MNTFLGAYTSYTLSGLTNSTAVGASVSLAQSNTVILGNNANVGIGTSTPTAKLEVASADAKIHGLTVGRGGGSMSHNTAL